MENKVLFAYVAADFLFVVAGAIMLGFCAIVQQTMYNVPTEGVEAAKNLLYRQFPLRAGIVDAVFVLVTFLITMPGIITPTRGWIKLGAYMTTACALFTLYLGLYIWILTLRTKELFLPIWTAQNPETQSLMQMAFNCCGYFNSSSPAFVTDPTCPSPAAAAMLTGCASPIASFANLFENDIFTTVFGMVAIDVIFIVAAACLVKERKEQERFRYIDEKAVTF